MHFTSVNIFVSHSKYHWATINLIVSQNEPLGQINKIMSQNEPLANNHSIISQKEPLAKAECTNT